MRRIIKSWTPNVLQLEIRTIDIVKAHDEMEAIRPTGYDQVIMIKFEGNVAYGEIDMCIWSIEEQMKIIKNLEEKGWKWE